MPSKVTKWALFMFGRSTAVSGTLLVLSWEEGIECPAPLALAPAAGAALEAPLLPLDLAAAVGAGAAGDLDLLGGKGRILHRGPGGLGDGLREAGEHRLEIFEVPF